jgi:hypothetical protein
MYELKAVNYVVEAHSKEDLIDNVVEEELKLDSDTVCEFETLCCDIHETLDIDLEILHDACQEELDKAIQERKEFREHEEEEISNYYNNLL